MIRGRYTYVEMCHDFLPVYTGSRCLLHGCSPYDPNALYREFVSAGGRGYNPRLWTNGVSVYPPTTFLVVLPLASLPISTMDVLWMALVLASVCGTSLLMADLASDFALLPAAIPIAILPLASSIAGMLGQPAAVEVGIVGFCFWASVRQKWPWLAAVLLGIGFVFKPQLAVALALWLILQPGFKRLLATRAVAVAILLTCTTLAVCAMRPATRTWLPQLRSSLTVLQQQHHYDANGNETRMFNSNYIGVENPDAQLMTNLQVVAAIWSVRRANLVALAVCSVLLAVWGWAWWRVPKNYATSLLALGALCPLTFLPVYHRQYDAALWLIAMPAVAVLWAHNRKWGLAATIVSVLAAIWTWHRYMQLVGDHVRSQSHFVIATALRSPVWASLLLATFFIVALICYRQPRGGLTAAQRSMSTDEALSLA